MCGRITYTVLHMSQKNFAILFQVKKNVTVAKPYSASLLCMRFVYPHTNNWPCMCFSSCILQCKGAGVFMINLHISVVIRH